MSSNETLTQRCDPTSTAQDPQPEPLPFRQFANELFAAQPVPSGFPRNDWTATSFSGLFFASPLPCLEEIEWGCKKASLAVAAALRGHDWSPIRDPATAIMLAVVDKVLQLNYYARDSRCVTGWLGSIEVWEEERERDIDATLEMALDVVAEFNLDLSSLTRARVHQAALIPLYQGYMCPSDAMARDVSVEKGTLMFQRDWFGEFVPKPSDLDAYGLYPVARYISAKDKNFERKALREAEKFARDHPESLHLPACPNPLQFAPPTTPPPETPVPQGCIRLTYEGFRHSDDPTAQSSGVRRSARRRARRRPAV